MPYFTDTRSSGASTSFREEGIFELNILGSIVAIGAAVVLIVVGERVGALSKRSGR